MEVRKLLLLGRFDKEELQALLDYYRRWPSGQEADERICTLLEWLVSEAQ